MPDLDKVHRERISKLREVFGRRKEIALRTGKKHDVSISKICLDAGVDKVYMFGYRLKEGDKNKASYLALRADILEFQNKLPKEMTKSDGTLRLEELEFKYKTLLGDIEPLQRDLAYYQTQSASDLNAARRDQDKITQLLAKISQLESNLSVAHKSLTVSGGIAARVQAHILSPDANQVEKTKPFISSKQEEQESWGLAYGSLEQLLSRQLKMRLYILVGLPCSGKSTWAREAILRSDRHPIIWDARNSSIMERYKFVSSLSRFPDLPKSCVFFDTDLNVILERQRKLRILNKSISSDDLKKMADEFEKPNPYEEVWMEELIIVRTHAR